MTKIFSNRRTDTILWIILDSFSIFCGTVVQREHKKTKSLVNHVRVASQCNIFISLFSVFHISVQSRFFAFLVMLSFACSLVSFIRFVSLLCLARFSFLFA